MSACCSLCARERIDEQKEEEDQQQRTNAIPSESRLICIVFYLKAEIQPVAFVDLYNNRSAGKVPTSSSTTVIFVRPCQGGNRIISRQMITLSIIFRQDHRISKRACKDTRSLGILLELGVVIVVSHMRMERLC